MEALTGTSFRFPYAYADGVETAWYAFLDALSLAIWLQGSTDSFLLPLKIFLNPSTTQSSGYK